MPFRQEVPRRIIGVGFQEVAYLVFTMPVANIEMGTTLGEVGHEISPGAQSLVIPGSKRSVMNDG